MVYQNLEEFNIDGVLSNLLAIEEHSLGAVNIDTWCKKKHYFLGCFHHGLELQQLMSSKDPVLANKIGEFRNKWGELMDNNASAGEIRELRNEFREIISDPTLDQPQSTCGVCALDKSSKMERINFAEKEQFVYDDDDQFEKIPDIVEKSSQKMPSLPVKIHNAKKTPNKIANKKGSSVLPLLIIGGIVVIGAIALIASRRA